MENIKERYDKLAQTGFNSKATYLAWVEDWKWFYVELSNYIRETRAEIKETQRSFVCGAPLWRLMWGIGTARHYATAALLLRSHSKKEAAYQVIVMAHEESNDDVIRDAAG